MSLHSLAHHLQSAGRGQDSVLVHMTPREVGGLQALARAHGGSLTINPETGLPEAGFLSSILPMIAGGLLMATGIGAPIGAAILGSGASAAAAGALGSSLLVGGGTALATGDLKKGLMAGMGAYGGAGLAGGLAQAGTAAAANTVAPSAANEIAKQGLFANPTMGMTAGDVVFNAAQRAGTNAATSGINNLVSNQVAGMAQGLGQAGIPATPTPAPSLAGVPTTAGTQGIKSAAELAAETPIAAPAQTQWDKIQAGFGKATSGMDGLKSVYNAMPTGSAMAAGSTLLGAMAPDAPALKKNQGMIRPYEFSRDVNEGVFDTGAPIWSDQPGSSAEKRYFTETMTPLTPYKAPGPEYKATGGLTSLAIGGPVETMSAENAVGDNLMYPQANINTPLYANPAVQRPEAVNVIAPSVDAGVGAFSGEPRFAAGGLSSLGGYSDGGRLLKGPGDGVSDSIPAVIGNKQPARLADGEFVVPARIVSEIGNGSTEAGARKLYAMMDRVQKARRKTVGKDKVAANTNADKYLPA